MKKINSLIKKTRFLYATKDCVSSSHYFGELEGITVIFQEESYTSKCSFFDQEEICEHEDYLGKRIKRGLYRTNEGNIVNADVNGSYNIMKKAIPNAFANGIEGLGVNPSVISVKR